MEYFIIPRGDGFYYVRKDDQGGELYFGPYPDANQALIHMEDARKYEQASMPGTLHQNLNAPSKESFLEEMPWRFR